MEKILISLFDLTGNASEPYRKNGWKIIQIDIQLGIDIFKWEYRNLLQTYPNATYGMIIMMPCTCYALSGNRHKKTRSLNGEFAQAQKLVAQVMKIISYYQNNSDLLFWMLEQPMTDIHKHNGWIGQIVQKINPCDYAGYDPIPRNSRYNKETWLFGEFNEMKKKYLKPLSGDSPIWKGFGGRSIKTKNARSITPLGFAYAFYNANH